MNRRLYGFALLLAALGFVIAQNPASANSPSQQQQEVALQILAVGIPIERELKGGETHSYQINLTSGDYFKAVVEQKGIDVVVTVFDPNGMKIIEIDSPNGTQGPEPVYLIAEATGIYKLEVTSLEKDAKPGKYEAKAEEIRVHTEQDKIRIAAQKAFAEAELLRAQGTKESLQKAIEKYLEALPLQRATNDSKSEATTLIEIGLIYNSLGEEKKALDYFNQALPIIRDLGNRTMEAVVLNSLGLVYKSLGEKQKALDYYNQALLIIRVLGNRAREAATLTNIGAVYNSLGDRQKALDYYNQALPIQRAVGDRFGEANTLANIGVVYSSLGERQKALDYYNQALPIIRIVNDQAGEAATLTNVGSVYYSLGQIQKALDYFSQALPLQKAVGDRPGEAVTLNSIGRVYDSLGEKQKALNYFSQALPLRKAVGDRTGEAATLNNIGKVYDSLGEKQKALDYFSQALPLQKAVGDRAGEATTLNNIGSGYYSLGEKQKALDYYNQALPLRKAVGDRAGEAATLNNIGLVYNSLGEKQKALDYYNQALPLRKAVGDRAGEATTLNNIGSGYYSLGEKQKALDYYNQALPLQKAVGDRAGEAITAHNIGFIYNSLGEKRKALDYYNQALLLRRTVGDRAGEVITLFGISCIERDQGNIPAARDQTEKALELIEFIRSSIGSQELRSSYFATVQNYYQFYSDLLMQMHESDPKAGHDKKALQANERARARGLLELLAEARTEIRKDVDPQLLEQENALRQRLNGKTEYQIKLLSGNHSKEQADALQKELDQIKDELQTVELQIRRSSPRYEALKYPEPLNADAIQQQVLDPKTALLEFSLGEERSWLWLVTHNSVETFKLPKRSEIEAAAEKVYQYLTAREPISFEIDEERKARIDRADAEYPQAASDLSNMLLAQVAGRLQKKRLLIVADGILQYIPFAALPSPNDPIKGNGNSAKRSFRPLITNHEIISLPSATTLAVLRREEKKQRVYEGSIAIFADPVFSKNDERLKPEIAERKSEEAKSKPEEEIALSPIPFERAMDAAENADIIPGGAELPRLKQTRIAADRILKLAPPKKSKPAFDFDASRELALSSELGKYRFVHFATHGFLNAVNPELSGIVLSLVDKNGKPQSGFLGVSDIFNLDLPVELVALQACQTGLGIDPRKLKTEQAVKDRFQKIRNEGIVGLTRGFMYAGASRVMVSLWRVGDRSSSELMVRFYGNMLGTKRLSPAAALRAAQLEMMRTKWSKPYYWAGFIIQGEY